MSNESTFRNPLQERSPLLIGCNNEVRALTLGIAAIQGGTTDVHFVADALNPEGMEKLLVLGPKKVNHIMDGAHPFLLEAPYVHGEAFTLTDRGTQAAGLGGILLDFVRNNGSSLHFLLGKARTFDHTPDAISAPSSRLAIYDSVLAANRQNGQRLDLLVECLTGFGISEESIRKHLKHLLNRGWFTKEVAGRTRVIKVNPNKREFLQSFSDTVHNYLERPDLAKGLAKVEEILKNPKVLPFLIKHATTSQGDRTRQPSNDLQRAAVLLLESLPPGSRVTTAQIAKDIGKSVAYVNVMLNTAVTKLGPKSPIRKVPTEPRKKAYWTLAPPVDYSL